MILVINQVQKKNNFMNGSLKFFRPNELIKPVFIAVAETRFYSCTIEIRLLYSWRYFQQFTFKSYYYVLPTDREDLYILTKK